MNYPRLFLAAFLAFFCYFACGFLFEGWLIRDDFLPYAAVYRSTDALRPLMPLGMLGAFVGLVLLTVLYSKLGRQAGAAAKFRFALIVGTFVSCIYPLSNFVILNIGWKLGMETVLSAFVLWTIAATVITLIYKPAAAATR